MAKKKNPEGEKLKRALPFKLDDEQKARKAEASAKLNKSLEEAMEAKKADMTKHNTKLKELQKKLSAQLKMINEGIERRDVDCVMVKNYEKNQLEFYHEGEMMEAVEMKPGDRQMGLNEAEKKGAAKKEKWQKLAPKHKAKGYKDDDEETKDEEIASVHKLETSRKGASSMVDPQ